VSGDDRRLAEVLRREERSLLQYVRAAEPWTPPAERKQLAEVRRMADAEAAALDRLAAFLQGRRVPLPNPAAFPTAFTSLNYVALRTLLPRLVAEQSQDVAELEADHQALSEAGRCPVAELLGLKRAHLEELRKLADSRPQG
jgi:hypothetical protein